MNICEISISRAAVTQSVGTRVQILSPLREMFRDLRCGIGKYWNTASAPLILINIYKYKCVACLAARVN